MTSLAPDLTTHPHTPLVDALHTAVMVLDNKDRVMKLNQAGEKLFGVSARQVVGKNLSSLVIDSQDLLLLSQKVRTAEQSFSLRTLELDLRPEQTVILDCHACPSYFAGATCVLLELHDVTEHERIQREAELIKQHGVSRTIVRQLAHEIKNPLGGIRGSAQLLNRKLQKQENHKFIEVIIAEVDRLVNLVDSMLGPGRPLQLKYSNIHEIIDRGLELVASEMGSRVALHRDYDPSLPELKVDADQILQALLNLLRNACQALDSKGTIVVRTRAEFASSPTLDRNRLYAMVEIQDNGRGVPDDLGNKIFFPLVSGRDGGTGIGLALVQELIERHKGRVEYRSRPGETVFTVMLPITREST